MHGGRCFMARGRLLAMLHYDIPVYIILYFNPCNFASNCRSGLIFPIWVCVYVSEFLLCDCMSVSMWVCVFVCKCGCVRVCVPIYGCVDVCLCMCGCVSVSVCVSVTRFHCFPGQLGIICD